MTFPGWATAISAGPPDEVGQAVTFVVDSVSIPGLFSAAPTIGPDGTLAFTSAKDQNGVATVTAHVVDTGGTANGGEDTGLPVTFTITVQPVNDMPVCTPLRVATSQNSPVSGQLTCTDVDGDTLHFHKVASPTHGSATVNDDGTFTYQPVASFVNSADSLTFRADDGALTSPTVTLTIDVEPDPTAHNDLASVIQGTGPNPINVLANDVDRDPTHTIAVTSVTQGTKGRVTITGGGTGVSYDPTGLLTGTDSFTYTITDTAARTSQGVVFITIARDTLTPVAAAPVTAVISPATLGSTTMSVRVTWPPATDVGTGVKSYQLQESASGGTYRSVTLSPASTRSVARSVTLTRSYRYRVRAVDAVGNVGAWVTGPSMVFGRYQETATSVAYGGSWSLSSSSSFYGGKARFTGGAGATATFTFTGSSVGWLAALGPTRGSATVAVDGVAVSAVSLHSSRTTYRRMVFARSWPTVGPHTVTITVLRTAGHPRIDLDAFIVIR